MLGFFNLLTLIGNIIEMTTFYLVVFLMMPITETAKQKHIALKQFLLNGFLKPEELAAAVIAQDPEMPEETKNFIRHDCQWVGSLMGTSAD